MANLKSDTRGLLKNPDSTAVAVMTLELGIGANLASYSVVSPAEKQA